MKKYRDWRKKVIDGYELANWLATQYRERFSLEEGLKEEYESFKNHAAPLRTGGLRFALPKEARVSLYDQYRAKFICNGLFDQGEWKPTQDRFAPPQVIKLYLWWDENRMPTLTFRPRPGITFGEPYKGHGRPLFSLERVLWAFGQSQEISAYGSLGVIGTDRDGRPKAGWYPLWGLWSLDEDDLLRPSNDTDLEYCEAVDPIPNESLTQTARRLVAEILGVSEWHGPGLPGGLPDPEFPLQWELLKVRLGPSNEQTPCLVISPNELNVCGDLVVLQCIPYHPVDDQEAVGKPVTVVPLPTTFQFAGTRWTIGLLLVRGIGLAESYWERFESNNEKPGLDLAGLDEDVFKLVRARLEDLYA